uniref:ATPase family protein n=1 Tax=Megaviridae environmental sample TaxID=1737588 RepID=A0A5J6VHK5_9VIRU|nr:MAG: ATPase family protein [Megaviridae environmental sample]
MQLCLDEAPVELPPPPTNVPWVEKYRPRSLDDIKSQDGFCRVLKEFIKIKSLPHLLLYGPPGCGKTSTIMALARDMFGVNYKFMVLELNASDDRGISVIREKIKSFARLKNFVCFDLPKLIVLDEADSLTDDAQFALRRVIEKYTSNVRFCLICNYIHKLIPAIQSRCLTFQFASIADNTVVEKLTEIITAEELDVDVDVINVIVSMGESDMRKNINCLQILSKNNTITIDSVFRYFFQASKDTFDILISAMNMSFEERQAILIDLSQQSLSIQQIIDMLAHWALVDNNYTFVRELGRIQLEYMQSNANFEWLFVNAIACIPIE